MSHLNSSVLDSNSSDESGSDDSDSKVFLAGPNRASPVLSRVIVTNWQNCSWRDDVQEQHGPEERLRFRDDGDAKPQFQWLEANDCTYSPGNGGYSEQLHELEQDDNDYLFYAFHSGDSEERATPTATEGEAEHVPPADVVDPVDASRSESTPIDLTESPPLSRSPSPTRIHDERPEKLSAEEAHQGGAVLQSQPSPEIAEAMRMETEVRLQLGRLPMQQLRAAVADSCQGRGDPYVQATLRRLEALARSSDPPCGMWGSLANKTWASTSQSTGGSCMRPSDSRSGTRRTYPVLADPDARASRVVTSPSEAAEVASACNREISGILRRLTSELPVSGYSEAAGGLEPTSPPRRSEGPGTAEEAPEGGQEREEASLSKRRRLSPTNPADFDVIVISSSEGED